MQICGTDSEGGVVYPGHWMTGLEWGPHWQAAKPSCFVGQRRTCIGQVVYSNQRQPEIQSQRGQYPCKTKSASYH